MPMTLEDLEAAASAPESVRAVLIVDEDRSALKFLDHQIRAMGYKTVLTDNGVEALSLVKRAPNLYGAVVVDRMMPLTNGVTMVEQIKSEPTLRGIPVIVQNENGAPDGVGDNASSDSLRFIAKPINVDMLRTTLRSAMREFERNTVNRQTRGNAADGFAMMQGAQFRCRTPNEAKALAVFLSQAFPEPDRVIAGIEQLILNGIEHGNLGIGHNMKKQLSQDGLLRQEIEKRLNSPQFGNKEVQVTMTRKDDGVYIVISDQGDGFDWRGHLKIDPAHAGSLHGRGIAMAGSVCFDKLLYNDKGNKVVGFVAEQSAIQW